MNVLTEAMVGGAPFTMYDIYRNDHMHTLNTLQFYLSITPYYTVIFYLTVNFIEKKCWTVALIASLIFSIAYVLDIFLSYS